MLCPALCWIRCRMALRSAGTLHFPRSGIVFAKNVCRKPHRNTKAGCVILLEAKCSIRHGMIPISDMRAMRPSAFAIANTIYARFADFQSRARSQKRWRNARVDDHAALRQAMQDVCDTYHIFLHIEDLRAYVTTITGQWYFDILPDSGDTFLCFIGITIRRICRMSW